ncbi:MAG: DUF481 domain-containing protein [Saprospiraceae bacterium]|nr:DUF481 domain-containing protein [Saprospiraceae bacterium]MCF8249513.1 DUF481 domain-containing protein [Saprospiraceae bacterium]MCF8280138.1 DUF481 domain-containing protein [Bacteroidales bacterium]MCF8310731.1 DUF481 domain-containing protein [Saprospiraceae bacterium]MCF8439438.1 DUF481 domain-containing protein [Saprospiraceae bacterium]
MKYFTISLLALLPTLLSAQIVNIEEQRITGTNDSTHWYGNLRFGANLIKVQEQVLQLNTAAQVEYKQDKSLVLFLMDGRFLRAGGKQFNNAGFAHLRYNRKLTGPLSTEVFAQAQFNKLLYIELRTLGGGGLRYRIFKNASGKSRVYFGSAYLFEHNRFTDATADRNWHRLSNYLSFTFRPWQGVTLVSTTYFQPQLTDWNNYRLATECRLDTPLGKKISFFTDFTLQTDKALPKDAPVVTYAWLNGLTLKF